MNHYNPEVIETEIFARIPDKFRQRGSHPGTRSTYYVRQPEGVDCYIEGPSFDRDGNLYFTDIPYGRIFRMEPDGTIDLATEYDGEPNGL